MAAAAVPANKDIPTQSDARGNEDAPSTSTQPSRKSKIIFEDGKLTKKVSLGDDGNHSVTIGATLSTK